MSLTETTNVWINNAVQPYQNGSNGANYLCARGQGSVNGVRHTQWSFRIYGTGQGSIADIPLVIPVAIHFTCRENAITPSNPAIGTNAANLLMTFANDASDLARKPLASMTANTTYCKHVVATLIGQTSVIVEPAINTSSDVIVQYETTVDVFVSPAEMPLTASSRLSVQATLVAGNYTNLLTLTTLSCDVTVTTLVDI